jgi:hypothetical protein
MAKFEPSVETTVKSVVKQIEETKIRQKSNSMDGMIVGFLWDQIEDGHLAQWLNFYYLEMVETSENGVETKKPTTAKGIADRLGWRPGWVRRIINSLNVAPRDVSPVIKLGGRTYRPIFIDPVRLEKLLREFVVGYECNKLFSVLGVEKPPKVTVVTEVTPLGCVGGSKIEDIEVTVVTPECHPSSKNDENNMPAIYPLTGWSAVTCVTSVTEPPAQPAQATGAQAQAGSQALVPEPSQDYTIKYLTGLASGTQASKAHIEAALGVSHRCLQAAIDHLCQRGRGIIDRGASIEVL